ncbi:hypothetical protein ACSBR2_039739 [Camellia fascicularis]
MASFSMEDFVGNGSLKELLPKLIEEGWDDVPTFKIMNSQDMDGVNMTQQQKANFLKFSLKFDVFKNDQSYSSVTSKGFTWYFLQDSLEIRSYLHDRALMQYGDRPEASAKCLPKLLGLSTGDLSTQFGIKRGHIARFTDRTIACAAAPLPPSCALPSRRTTTLPTSNSIYKSEFISVNSIKMQSMTRSPARSSTNYDASAEQSMVDLKIKDGHIFKGIVAAAPAEPRACGCVQPPPIVDNVAPYSAIENISIQKLTPEYKIGTECLVKTKTPPMKALELWRDKPAVLVCIRRQGNFSICSAYWHSIISLDGLL